MVDDALCQFNIWITFEDFSVAYYSTKTIKFNCEISLKYRAPIERSNVPRVSYRRY